jgi:hypothetical protein
MNVLLILALVALLAGVVVALSRRHGPWPFCVPA